MPFGQHAVVVGQDEAHFTAPHLRLERQQDGQLVAAALQGAHTGAVVVGGVGVVVEGILVGATVHGQFVAVALGDHPSLGALRFACIGERGVLAGDVVERTNRLVDVLTFAVVGARTVVHSGCRVVVEGEGVGASFDLDFFSFAIQPKRDGLQGAFRERERAEVQVLGGHSHSQCRTVPTVAEAVHHGQHETTRSVVQAEVAFRCGVVGEALAFQQHACIVGQGEADFSTPHGGRQRGHGQHLVVATFGNHHARAVVVGGFGVVVDRILVGASVHGLCSAIAFRHNPRLGAFGLTCVGVGRVSACQVIVPAHRRIDVFAPAVVGACPVVHGGVRVVVECRRVGAPFHLHDFHVASHAKGHGLEVPLLEGEAAQGHAQRGNGDVQESAVPTVAEAVGHFQHETSFHVVHAEEVGVGAEVPEILSGDQHAVVVRNGVGDFTAPHLGGEGGQDFRAAILGLGRGSPCKHGDRQKRRKECGFHDRP